MLYSRVLEQRGTAIVGIIWFGEEVSAGKLLFLFVLLFGIIGLKLVNDEDEEEAI